MNEPEFDGGEDRAISPIARPEHLESHRPLKQGDFFSKCVWILCIVLIIAAFIASVVFFAGFAENDQNLTHLISAFFLSFGLGALAIGPLSVIGFYARKAINLPLSRGRALIVLLLILPWLFLSFYLFQLGGYLRRASIVFALSALFIAFWAGRFLKTR